MCTNDRTHGQRLHRRGRLGFYGEAKRLLTTVLNRASPPAVAFTNPEVVDADAIILRVLADRTYVFLSRSLRWL